jgi:hypothetical protein
MNKMFFKFVKNKTTLVDVFELSGEYPAIEDIVSDSISDIQGGSFLTNRKKKFLTTINKRKSISFTLSER